MPFPDLKAEYISFMERMGLPQTEISHEQYIMMQEAFMGACSVILLLLKEAPENEDEGVMLLENLWEQTVGFWSDKIAKKN